MALEKQFLIEVSLKREEVPSFDRYPFSLPSVRALDVLRLHPSVTFLIGENGSGKSTLLEAIAIAWGFNAEGGSKNFGFSTHRSHSELHKYLRLARGIRKPKTGWFLRAESFFNVASEIDRRDEEVSYDPPIRTYYGGVSLHEQSHGESFMALLTKRFGASGFYVLDEPEAALSPSRQLAALVRIDELVKAGAQFVVATHSPILMAYPNARILLLKDGHIREIEYTETDHYRTSRDFLTDHRAALAKLLRDTWADEG
jgi:predicted ATPase